MRKVIILTAILGIYCETSLAINAIGPPIATLKKGQFAIGFDYSFTEVDVEVSGYGVSAKLDDVEFESYLGKIGYGITHNWDIFGHFGSANIEWKEGAAKFDDNTKFNVGFRTKATIIEEKPFPWGLALQVNWLQKAKESFTILEEYSGSVDVDIWEIQIATGPTCKIGPVCIYGGPFVYFVRGDLELEALGYNYSFDIEEESIFGGFAGAQLDIGNNISTNIEYQLTSDSYAFGLGIVYKF